MRLATSILIFLSCTLALSCSSQLESLKDNDYNTYNEIVGTWYFLSGENFGKVSHTLTIENNLKVTGDINSLFNPLSIASDKSRDYYCEIKKASAQDGTLLIYSSDPLTGRIQESYQLVYNCSDYNEVETVEDSLYAKYLPEIRLAKLEIQGVGGKRKVIRYYVKNINYIKQIAEKNAKENKNEEVELFTIKNDLLKNYNRNQIIDLSDNNLHKKFMMAYFNDRENKNITNSIKYEGDEFSFQGDSKVFKDIRNKKFIFMDIDKEIIPEYDFKFNGYVYTQEFVKANFTHGYAVAFDLTKPIVIKLSPARAKEIRKILVSGMGGGSDFSNSNIEKTEENLRMMLQGIGENVYLGNGEEKFSFTKNYKLFLLFEIKNVKNEKMLMYNVKQIEIEPIRSIILLKNEGQYLVY